MDERILQYKELKKDYKKLRLKAGIGWKIIGWIFFALFVIVGCMTLFVLGNSLSLIQTVDQLIWQPVKGALGESLPYAMLWNLAQSYGILATAATAAVSLLCLLLGGVCKARVKHTETYRNYRTIKLTLETEKEER